jgi:hypothetical protein
MSREMIKEANLYYDNLSNNTNKIYVNYYTKCSDTYGSNEYMNWFPMEFKNLKN